MIEWFDDLKLGMRFKSGEATVSSDDIKRFAAEFDPQPFHPGRGGRRELDPQVGLRLRDGTRRPSR